jgi:cytochrome b pre-mRNA-processing protein 3
MVFRVVENWVSRTRKALSPAGQAAPPVAGQLYAACVAQARQAVFYTDFKVPDTLDGRFDMILLHVHLLGRHLSGHEMSDLGAALTDIMFEDMDQSLREMGVGDSSIGKRVRKMADAFLSRSTAYHAALEAGGGDLPAVLKERIYRDVTVEGDVVQSLAAYIKQVAADLETQPGEALRGGHVTFPQVVLKS